MEGKMRKYIPIITIVVLMVLGFVIKTSYDIPPNAIVYVDASSGKYYSPPTVDFYTDLSNNKESFKQGSDSALPAEMWKLVILPNLVKSTISSANSKGYKPDEWSEQHGEFKSEEHCLWVHILENLGLLPSSNRWNENGTWKY